MAICVSFGIILCLCEIRIYLLGLFTFANTPDNNNRPSKAYSFSNLPAKVHYMITILALGPKKRQAKQLLFSSSQTWHWVSRWLTSRESIHSGIPVTTVFILLHNKKTSASENVVVLSYVVYNEFKPKSKGC